MCRTSVAHDCTLATLAYELETVCCSEKIEKSQIAPLNAIIAIIIISTYLGVTGLVSNSLTCVDHLFDWNNQHSLTWLCDKVTDINKMYYCICYWHRHDLLLHLLLTQLGTTVYDTDTDMTPHSICKQLLDKVTDINMMHYCICY